MKADVKRLLKAFKNSAFKNGDLVITAEIHRVIDKNWGRKNQSRGMAVVTVWPLCSICKRECVHEHVMTAGAGQHSVMGLKP